MLCCPRLAKVNRPFLRAHMCPALPQWALWMQRARGTASRAAEGSLTRHSGWGRVGLWLTDKRAALTAYETGAANGAIGADRTGQGRLPGGGET